MTRSFATAESVPRSGSHESEFALGGCSMERQGFALVVFTFDEEDEARSALDALRNLAESRPPQH